MENLKELEDKYELIFEETEGLKKGLYIPRKNDYVDQTLGKYINNFPE